MLVDRENAVRHRDFIVDGACVVHDLLRQVEGVPFRNLEALLKGMDLQLSRGLNELCRAGAAFGFVD